MVTMWAAPWAGLIRAVGLSLLLVPDLTSSRLGQHTTRIGRPAMMEALGERGLTLSTSGRPPVHLIPDRLTLATGPEGAAGADYVLVTVKSAATAAAAHGLAAPANARLAALVREAERAPRAWAGPELYAEISAARAAVS